MPINGRLLNTYLATAVRPLTREPDVQSTKRPTASPFFYVSVVVTDCTPSKICTGSVLRVTVFITANLSQGQDGLLQKRPLGYFETSAYLIHSMRSRAVYVEVDA
jgi:hypothetical protein